MPQKFKKDPTKYLQDLHEKLQIAQKYADLHSKQAQQRYAAQYNKRAKDKHFSVNDKVLILQPDSTKSRVFSKFKGPATVVAVKSPYSYVVDLDGVKYRLHANQIRPYNVRADEVTFDSRAFDDQSKPKANVVKFSQVEDGDNYDGLCEMFKFDSNVQAFKISTCVRDEDTDFGELQPCELCLTGGLTDSMTESGVSLPSQKIDLNSLAHLTETQQKELLDVLDKYPDVFDDEP